MILLLEIIGVFGITVISVYCFIMSLKYLMQPKQVFLIEIYSNITGVSFPFCAYKLKYIIRGKTIRNKSEEIILEEANEIQIDKDKNKNPFDELEKLLKTEVSKVEKTLRKNNRDCIIFKTFITLTQ